MSKYDDRRNARRPNCLACRQPIWHGQPETRIQFANDTDGAQGLTGPYHQACSKPNESMAHAMKMLSWRGF